MAVEPLPNIRDGIFVERLVKTMRYVAEMRRCQYVVQRPEGGDGGSGSMSNTSIAAPAICLFFNTLIKACSSTIGPRDALINQAVGFILFNSVAPTRPRVRLLKTKWIVRMSACSNNWSLETRIAPAALAASGVMFWLQAISFIPKAVPIRATCDPTFPSPRTPKVFPRRSVPTVCCQPPERTELLSVTIWRAEAKIR